MPIINYVAIALSLCGLLFIVRLIQKGLFRERYAILWLAIGIIGVVVTASPSLVNKVCQLLNVTIPLNLLLFLAVVFLGCICIMLTAVVSRQAMRIEILAKEIALLKK